MEGVKYDLYDYLINLILQNKSLDEILKIINLDNNYILECLRKLRSNIITTTNENLFCVAFQIDKFLNIKYYDISYGMLKIIDKSDIEIMNTLNINSMIYREIVKKLYFYIYVYGSEEEKKYLSVLKNKINNFNGYELKGKEIKEIVPKKEKTIVNIDNTIYELDSEFGNVYDFDKDTFIVISDTHFGSLFENMSYLDKVYEYASKHNIKDIVLTGDLIEGTYDNYGRCPSKYKSYLSQIEHVLNDYCYDKNITNHILLGNHDLHSFVSDKDDISSYLKARNDFHILGYKIAYLRYKYDYITLKHDIPKVKNIITNNATYLNLSGHSHQYRCLYDKRFTYVKMPTLSDLDYSKLYCINKGFIVVNQTEDDILIDYIDIEDNSLKFERKRK